MSVRIRVFRLLLLFIFSAASIGCGSGGLTVLSQDWEPNTAIGTHQLHTSCSGLNRSPQVSWTGTVSDAVLSYAVSLTHRDDGNRIHWLIYDIPVTENSLVGALSSPPAGATIGPTDYGATGYRGPCLPGAGATTLELKVWAVTVAHLSEVSGTNLSEPSSILATLERRNAATGTLQVILTQ